MRKVIKSHNIQELYTLYNIAYKAKIQVRKPCHLLCGNCNNFHFNSDPDERAIILKHCISVLCSVTMMLCDIIRI